MFWKILFLDLMLINLTQFNFKLYILLEVQSLIDIQIIKEINISRILIYITIVE